jgi:uncharacterized Zn-finger protein
MSAATRQLCSGVGFEHDPVFLSIARARELLRCPICGFEVDLTGGPDR